MTTPDTRGGRTTRDGQELQQILHHYVPITAWLQAYPRDLFRNEMKAGVTNGGVMVPVAMAYAQIAGVPAEVGPTRRSRPCWATPSSAPAGSSR